MDRAVAEKMGPDAARLDEEILRVGSRLWGRVEGEASGVFNRGTWQRKLVELVMDEPSFKTDLFRFVDVLPCLRDPSQIARHIKEYLLGADGRLPPLVAAAFKVASSPLTLGTGARLLRRNVASMGLQFIAGRSPEDSLPRLRELRRLGLGFSADLLGELTLSHEEARAYMSRYLDLLQTLSKETSSWEADPLLDQDPLGPLPKANISLKVSALDPDLNPADPAGAVSRLKSLSLPFFQRARREGVFVNLDMESWDLHDIIYDFLEDLIAEPTLRSWPHLGVVVQAYLRDAPRDLERLKRLAEDRGAPITVRLVKGAYWDSEVAKSWQQGTPCPVFTEKAATDNQYETLSRDLLENCEILRPAFGSHNLRSLGYVMAYASGRGIPQAAYEFQMLYGMGESLARALREEGMRTRLYSPIGELIPGMAYLVRRLLENTANSGFLRLIHGEKTSLKVLLRRPLPLSGGGAVPVAGCPLSDFSSSAVRDRFQGEIASLRSRLPVDIPVLIAGKDPGLETSYARRCPSHPDLIVSKVALAAEGEADRAVLQAARAFPAWRNLSCDARALPLERLGDILERDRIALAALEIMETAKPWAEADADVAEAVDFCRYYAGRALEELAPRALSLPGESNQTVYEGRGPTAVISPWNFPLAIPCGMAGAALVTGNTVVFKPSLQASATGYALYARMIEAGFPPDVVQFLPGRGDRAGSRLVEHPLVANIAFTGGKAAGLSILEKASKIRPRQTLLKRVICEMGGKNAIIVDESADLDAAVAGVLRSAFGYAGQKCSACSRVLVVGRAANLFIPRLVEACRSLALGPADDPATFLGPVIDEESCARLWKVIHDPGHGAVPLHIGSLDRRGGLSGYMVPPAIFLVKDPFHRLMQEELFGPVLAVMEVPSFEAALEVANSTEYALTGAVYSRTPSHLAEAEGRFRVGNLYLNRPCTGARVDRQPFGGSRLSGLGTKAGGPGYLLNFAEARTITENTARHGFTPEIE